MSRERELLGRWHNGDLLPEEYMKLMKDTKELLAQPDINTQYLLDQVARLTAENAMLKEKWSAPKREPLGEEESYHEAKRLYEAEDGLWYADGFVDGLKFAEKMHGIGGGE